MHRDREILRAVVNFLLESRTFSHNQDPNRSSNGQFSRNGTLWNVGPRGWSAYSALMLAARITLAHFSVSLPMNLPNSAGELGITLPRRSADRALILGSAISSIGDQCGPRGTCAMPRYSDLSVRN
jgi:hypothetical protein